MRKAYLGADLRHWFTKCTDSLTVMYVRAYLLICLSYLHFSFTELLTHSTSTHWLSNYLLAHSSTITHWLNNYYLRHSYDNHIVIIEANLLIYSGYAWSSLWYLTSDRILKMSLLNMCLTNFLTFLISPKALLVILVKWEPLSQD